MPDRQAGLHLLLMATTNSIVAVTSAACSIPFIRDMEICQMLAAALIPLPKALLDPLIPQGLGRLSSCLRGLSLLPTYLARSPCNESVGQENKKTVRL